MVDADCTLLSRRRCEAVSDRARVQTWHSSEAATRDKYLCLFLPLLRQEVDRSGTVLCRELTHLTFTDRTKKGEKNKGNSTLWCLWGPITARTKKKRNHLISQLVFVILLTFIIDAEFPSPSFRSGARRASFSTRTDACLFVCLFFLCLYLCEQGVKSKRQLRVESCRVAGPPRARTGPLLVTVISGRLKLEILYHSPR